MNNDMISLIITLTLFVANMILLFQIFSSRYDLRISIGVLVLFTACELFVESLFGPLRFDYGGMRGLLYFPLLIILLKGTLFQKLFAFSLELVFTVSVALLVSETALYFFGSENPGYNIVRLAVLLPIYTAYVVIVTKKRRVVYEKLFAYGSRTEWALYTFVGLMSFGFMAISKMALTNTMYFIAILFFVLLSFGVLCFAIVNTHEKSKQQYEAEFAREVISSGRDHYQKMDEMYDKLRILRHDYKYHLIVIDELITSDNKEELSRYLDGIKTQFNESGRQSFCSNSVINALLMSYAERCERSDIAFTADVLLPKTLAVPNFDLCIVVGNLLENAVEACQKRPDGRKIDMILKPLDQQLALRVRNSYNGQGRPSKGQIRSMKKDGGYGLRSVEAVAARYGGELFIDWDEELFSAYVTLQV